MLKIIWGVFVGCILSTHTNADWERVGSTDEHNYYIDADKIRKASEYGKSYLKVWVKQVIFNDITKDGYSVDDYSIVLWHVNCDELTLGVKSYAEYRKKGRLERSDQNSFVSMRDVIPSSIGEAVLDKSCQSVETQY